MNQSSEMMQGPGFSVQVVRTNRRKTASIQVVDGQVRVVVPKRLDNEMIQELVQKKTRWIHKKLLLQREVAPIQPKLFLSGECFPYLGDIYRLEVTWGEPQPPRLDGGQLVAQVRRSADHQQVVREALVKWYQAQAKEMLTERTHYWAKHLALQPTDVRVKGFKSRWGSCHGNGRIQLNWVLVLAPLHIIDYVIVHELCHLIHLNHSPAFWQCVQQVIPDYRERRAWLKREGSVLWD
jgi:predicted metal-dependent hydrolase